MAKSNEIEVVKINNSKQADSPYKKSILEIVQIMETFCRDEKTDLGMHCNLFDNVLYTGFSSLYFNLAHAAGQQKAKKMLEKRIAEIFREVTEKGRQMGFKEDV